MEKPVYVPILKLKNGEVTAISGLTHQQRQDILPVFEVVFSSPKKSDLAKDRTARLESIVKKFLVKKLPLFPTMLLEARGGMPFILDFTLIFIDSVKATTIEYILRECAKNDQNVIVSINVGDTQEYKNLVYDYVRKHGVGLCIRVSRSDLQNAVQIDSKLKTIAADAGLELSQIDLLVDIKEEREDQNYTEYFNNSQQIASINEWRNLIFANGAFPESMGGLKAGKDHDLSRTDWIRYNVAIGNKTTNRVPVYSDYSARYPIYDAEAEKHSPSPSIKYTTESNWRIMKGGDYDYGHYFVYSLALVSGTTYYSKTHCEGCKGIQEKADKCPSYLKKRAAKGGKLQAKGAGSSEEWIAISVSHHTVVTLDQLASRP